jgi:hypothetical protein
MCVDPPGNIVSLEAHEVRGGRVFPKRSSGNPADRPRGCRDHVNRAARLSLAGEGEALTRKAVELSVATATLAAK